MRVYYYTAQKYALLNIKNEHIKISLLDDLNDPFEFLGVDLTDKEFRKSFQAGRDEAAKSCGIISFSKDWHNPLMWGHYGDKHKGICLGFDIDDSHIKEVTYFPERMPAEIDMKKKYGGLTEEIIENLLCTKYIDWKYENEVRVIVHLEEKDPSGFYFTDFKGNLELKEIILGPRCDIGFNEISKYLKLYKSEITVIKSRIAFKKYKVVKNQSIKNYIHNA
jgi:hypothetical protein